MTNDGDLVNRLSHPRYGVSKTYRVRIDGYLRACDIELLKKGLWLGKDRPGGKDAQPAGAASVKVVQRDRNRSVLEIVLGEGRNRQVRRMMARLGYKVRELTRIKIGPLSIRSLPTGAYRKLTSRELAKLRSAGE
jgi:23S rRNA pseudouridine2605 synthase